MTYLDTKSAFQKEAEQFLKSKGFTQGVMLKNIWCKEKFEFKVFSKSFQLWFGEKIVTEISNVNGISELIRIYETKISKTKKDRHEGVKKPILGSFRATYLNGWVSVYDEQDNHKERIGVLNLEEPTKKRIREVFKPYGLRVNFNIDRSTQHTRSNDKGLLKMPNRV